MSIKENISEIRKNIPNYVNLIAVSKTKSVEEIKEAYDAGIRDFGENKVQELIKKKSLLPEDVRWHLIGHLQRNKVKYIAGEVELIHSLDSIRLLEELESQYSSRNAFANTLIQINIGREGSKTGICLEELESLILACEKCNNVKVNGLMAIIPKSDEQGSRFFFREMKKIWNDLKQRSLNNIEMKYLSMGMSDDYIIAISEGANMVRIGTGIFGSRK